MLHLVVVEHMRQREAFHTLLVRVARLAREHGEIRRTLHSVQAWAPAIGCSVLGSWVETMRGAVRNKGRCKRRRTPAQDPSTS